MYAERKGFPLERAQVTLRHNKIHAEDCATCETEGGRVDRIEVEIEVTGDMDDETRKRIVDIAKSCPVHRTLQSEIVIESSQKN
jgi:putative redox protein